MSTVQFFGEDTDTGVYGPLNPMFQYGPYTTGLRRFNDSSRNAAEAAIVPAIPEIVPGPAAPGQMTPALDAAAIVSAPPLPVTAPPVVASPSGPVVASTPDSIKTDIIKPVVVGVGVVALLFIGLKFIHKKKRGKHGHR
jgi:hypothetical protein